MTRRITLAVIVGTTVLAGCPGGTPSTGDARDYFEQRLQAEVSSRATVEDFSKTDGLKSIKDGVETYQLDFAAKTHIPDGRWGENDTYRGTVTYIRSEQGWRAVQLNASSEAEMVARQKEAQVRVMQTRAKLGISTLESALTLYKLDNGTYPSTEQGLHALLEEPKTEPRLKFWKSGGYIRKGQEKDPWGNDYHYEFPGKHDEVDIYSLGEDIAPGGTGLATDIANWNLPR